MEATEKNKLTSDTDNDLELDVTPVMEGRSESDHERSLESSGFQRGAEATMSLGRSFKGQHWQQSASSVASNPSNSGKAGGFIGNLFNSFSKKDKYKDVISQLQTEIAYRKTQSQNDAAKMSYLRKENAKIENEKMRLEHENSQLKIKLVKLEQDHENLKKNNEDLQTCEKRIISSVSQVLNTYGEKIAFLDSEKFQHLGSIGNVDNVQIGNKNIQNISNVDMDGIDRLFCQYHEKLENVTQEWNQAMGNLKVTKIMLEQLNQKVLVLEDMQKEVIEALNDAKDSKKQEMTTELDYTISLTDPRLIAECVDALQQLPKRTEAYKFSDLEGHAKVGVLRVYKKYVKRLNVRRFVQRLEMEEVFGAEMTTDTPLQKDVCASLLVQWVQMHKDNDADALLERFPKIKPGSDTRHGKMYSHNGFSMESVSSNDELFHRTSNLKEGIISEIKQTVQNEIGLLTPQLEEIKNKLDEKRTELHFV